MSNVHPIRLAICVAAVFRLSFTAACAQSEAEIQAAAESEARLVWYAAMRSDQTEMLIKKFEADYPKIKVSYVHFTSGDITARVVTEQRGRQYSADIVSSSSFAVSQMKAQKLLEPFPLPAEATRGMAPGSWDPQGFWVSEYGLTFPISYNPKALAAAGLKPPSSFEDLTKPEWSGRFAIAAAYYDWYEGLSDAIGHDKAKDLITRMAANQPLIRAESGVLLQLLEAGEFAATFHVYGYNTYADKAAGKPVEIVNASPVVVSLQTGGIPLHPPHPNAARLFQLWMTKPSTQTFISKELGRTSTHEGVENEPGVYDVTQAEYHIIDPDEQVTKGRAMQKEYESIFGVRP